MGIGYFEGGSSIFGFSNGIIISSGDILLAEGPNVSVKSGIGFGDNTGDDDIDIMTSGAIMDVAGIEFDFVPIGESVTFRYVFASEEYCEFVGSIFNDVFGFFVSGPGLSGPFSNNAVNVALIPGTTEYVAINSVNHTDNSTYYIGNELEQDTDKCGIPFQPSFLEEIEYDGMTTALTATIPVVPCETYHIRMLVADVGDDILDSGVFLEGESFDMSSEVSIHAEVPNSTELNAVEGCLDGQFVFTRNSSNLDQPLTVNFSIDPSSTAENGVDFSLIPNSITIPAGQSNAFLPIVVLGDGLNEIMETLTLNLDFPCDCEDPVSATLFINDEAPFEIENTEVEICAGQEFALGPTILNGAAPFTYLWEDGSTDSTITATIDQTSVYNVTITDGCGAEKPAIVSAILQPVPQAVLSGEAIFCDGQTTSLEVEFEGNPPWSFQYSIDGQMQMPITDVLQSPYQLTTTAAGLYELVQFTDAFCEGTATGSVLVENGGGQIEHELSLPSCPTAEDGAIEVFISGGIPPYNIIWSPPLNGSLHPTNLPAGIYQLQITDAMGCITIEDISLFPNNPAEKCKPYKMYVPNAFSPNDDGFNDEFRFFPAENSNIGKIKSLHIFNRWGAIVFEKNEFQPDSDMSLWDGRFNGKILDAGVFVWQAVLLLEDGSEEIASGDLTLVR